MDNGRTERTFTIPPGRTPRIIARTPNGTITVVGEERADISVAITVHPADAVGRDIEVIIEQHGDSDVHAEVRGRRESAFGWLRGNSRIAIEIRTPLRSDVDTESASGNVSVERLAGTIRSRTASGEIRANDLSQEIFLQTASGDITAHALSGEIRINSASGDVTLQRGQGELDIHTASGDVQLDQITGRLAVGTASGDCGVRASALASCHAKTASGDLQLTTPLAQDGEYDFQTVSGDLTLQVPEETAATVAIRTVSGSLSSSLPAVSDGGKKNRTLTINGGGVPVRVKTVSGDCTIRAARDPLPAMPSMPAMSARPVPPTPPAPPAPPTPPAWPPTPVSPVHAAMPPAEAVGIQGTPQADGFSETLAVLQAVERGELTIDEAMARLSDLEGEGEAPST